MLLVWQDNSTGCDLQCKQCGEKYPDNNTTWYSHKSHRINISTSLRGNISIFIQHNSKLKQSLRSNRITILIFFSGFCLLRQRSLYEQKAFVIFIKFVWESKKKKKIDKNHTVKITEIHVNVCDTNRILSRNRYCRK